MTRWHGKPAPRLRYRFLSGSSEEKSGRASPKKVMFELRCEACRRIVQKERAQQGGRGSRAKVRGVERQHIQGKHRVGGGGQYDTGGCASRVQPMLSLTLYDLWLHQTKANSPTQFPSNISEFPWKSKLRLNETNVQLKTYCNIYKLCFLFFNWETVIEVANEWKWWLTKKKESKQEVKQVLTATTYSLNYLAKMTD